MRSCDRQDYPFLAGALILIVIILSHNIGCGIIYLTWRDSSRNEKNDSNLKVGHIWC